MFGIEVEGGCKHRVVDPVSGVSLDWLVAGGPYFTEVFSLECPGGDIPFTTARVEGIDADTGLPFFTLKFLTFGSAPRAHRNTKRLIDRTFADDEEKLRWMRVATEALLVFGWAYNGLNAPHPRYVRVELNAQTYTAEDFGYTLNADEEPAQRT